MRSFARTFTRRWGLRVLALLGTGALLLSVSGSSCSHDETPDMVITVDLISTYHAQGSTNVYNGSTLVALADSVNLDQIRGDNGLDSLKSIAIEAVFYRIKSVDAGASGRTIANTAFKVKETGSDETLFSVTSALVNDPALANWTAAPLETGGVSVLNGALTQLVAGGHPSLTFTVSGTSEPVTIATDFWWEAKVRLQVLATKKITVWEPLP